MGFYCVSLILVARALWFFRKTGGIRGLNATDNLFEDKLIGGAKYVGGKIGEKAVKAHDKSEAANAAETSR